MVLYTLKQFQLLGFVSIDGPSQTKLLEITNRFDDNNFSFDSTITDYYYSGQVTYGTNDKKLGEATTPQMVSFTKVYK